MKPITVLLAHNRINFTVKKISVKLFLLNDKAQKALNFSYVILLKGQSYTYKYFWILFVKKFK